MPICPSGSEPKPDAPQWVLWAGTALIEILTGRLRWLAPFISAVAPYAVETESLCASDPPDMPEFTVQDVLGLVGAPGGTGNLTAWGKVQDAVANIAWYQFCKCITGSTPAAPAPPNAPIGLPVPEPNRTLACASPSSGRDTAGLTGCRRVLGGRPDFMTFEVPHPLPPGATKIAWRFENIPNGATPRSIDFRVAYYSAVMADGTWVPGSQIGGAFLYNVASGASFSIEHTLSTSPSALSFSVEACGSGSPFNTTNHIQVDASVYCGGAEPLVLQPACCPPDPTIVAKLDSLTELVTLLQRQVAPFAYVPGTTTTGLTGSGEVAIQGLVAVSLELTTLPGHYGLEEGDPDRLFDIGWLAPGTPDGFEAPRRITTSPFFMRVSGDHTKIGYTLSPGVVATLRRHVREP